MHEIQAIVGPIGSGFQEFVKSYASSLPELVDFDNSQIIISIYEEVRLKYGSDWWNSPNGCKLKDAHVSSVVKALTITASGTDRQVYLTTEPSFLLLEGDVVGVLPLPSDIVSRLRLEAKSKSLPVPTTIGSAMQLYNAYREQYLARKVPYFQTVTEAYQYLQSLQAHAV
jgi:hypothetical protein